MSRGRWECIKGGRDAYLMDITKGAVVNLGMFEEMRTLMIQLIVDPRINRVVVLATRGCQAKLVSVGWSDVTSDPFTGDVSYGVVCKGCEEVR